MAKLCIALGLCAAAAFFSLSQFAVPRDREENKRQLTSLLSRFAVSQKVKEWALRSPLFQPQQDDPGATSFLSQLAEHPSEREDPDDTTLPGLDWFSTATQQLRTHAATSAYAAEFSSRLEEHKPETSTSLITYAETVASESMEEGTQQQPSLPLVNIHRPGGMTPVRDFALDDTTERVVEVTTAHQSLSELEVNENEYGEKISTSSLPLLDQEENVKVSNLSSVFAPEKPELGTSLNKDRSVTQTSSLGRDGAQDATVVSMSSPALATELPDVDAALTEPPVAERSSLAHERQQVTTGSGLSSVFVNDQPELDTTPNTEPSLAQKSSFVHDNAQATTLSNLGSVTAPENLELDARLNTERSSGQEALLAHDQGQDITAVSKPSSVYTSEQQERDVTLNTEPSIAQTTSSLQDQQETTFLNFSSVDVLEPHDPDTTLETELPVKQKSLNTTTVTLFSEAVSETAYVTTASSTSNTASRQEDDNIHTQTPPSSLPYQETPEITSTASTESTSDSDERYTTTTERVIEEPPGPKVVCYFTSWSLYRNGSGRFTPENIDAKLCTHIIYAFASLNSSTLKVIMADPWADADNELYKRATALKAANRRLRVLLSLGGWVDSGGSDDKYSRLASNASARRDFARDAATFLKKYRFDGLDIDWEYPNCASGACPSNPQDVQNFALFLKDLREAFDIFSPPLLLTAALSGNIEVIEEAYNVPEIFRQVDFASVMAYDYYGPWSSTTGHYAPFQAAMDETNPEISIEYVVNALLAMGAPASQLVLGVPFYARSFTLANPRKNAIGAPISGAGKPGPVTDTVGLLAYYEICSAIKAGGWTTMMDPDAGVYAYSGDQWVCFDGPRSIMRKARFALRRGLAGLMAWDLSMDDFLGVCGRANPLLNAARRGLYPPASRAAAASSG